MFTLSDDDGRAVDMLLDSRAAERPDGGDGRVPENHYLFAAAPAHLIPRIARVSEILELLKEYVPGDPPGGLVPRTLQAIEARREARFSPPVPAERPSIQPRPHA